MSKEEERIYVRPPDHLLAKDPKDFTEQDEKDFQKFVDGLFDQIARNSGHNPGKKKQEDGEAKRDY